MLEDQRGGDGRCAAWWGVKRLGIGCGGFGGMKDRSWDCDVEGVIMEKVSKAEIKVRLGLVVASIGSGRGRFSLECSVVPK